MTTRHIVSDAEIIERVVDEVRRLALAGVHPTCANYDRWRDTKKAPRYQTMLTRTHVKWCDILKAADVETVYGAGFKYKSVELVCDCGKPAVYQGEFVTLTSYSTAINGVMPLCPDCAKLAMEDKGIKVSLMYGVKVKTDE